MTEPVRVYIELRSATILVSTPECRPVRIPHIGEDKPKHTEKRHDSLVEMRWLSVRWRHVLRFLRYCLSFGCALTGWYIHSSPRTSLRLRNQRWQALHVILSYDRVFHGALDTLIRTTLPICANAAFINHSKIVLNYESSRPIGVLFVSSYA